MELDRLCWTKCAACETYAERLQGGPTCGWQFESVTSHMTVNHPQWGTMCEICFEQLTPETCAVDEDGQKWDVCKGECARQAGIRETKMIGR